MPSLSMARTLSKDCAGEVAVVAGAADEGEEVVFVPLVGGAGGDDLLGEDVEGRSGRVSESRSCWRMARRMAAHSTSSSRVVAKKRPLGMAPRQWPARPMRCRAVAMARGEPIWQTRSTWPMSMPSSSEAVAMRMRHSPCLRRRSDSSRRWRESEPWWAATCSSPMRSESRCEMRSTRRRVLTKTRVERCSQGKLLKALVDLVPQFVGGDGAKLGGGQLDGEIERAGGGDDDGDGSTGLRKIDMCRCVSGRENRLLVEKLGAVREI